MKQLKRLLIFLVLTSSSLSALLTTDVLAATNVAPVISGSPISIVTTGQLYSFTPIASDANNDPLTFSITNKPAWATFRKYSGRLTGTPTTGTYPGIVISVSDGKATTSLPAFAITVSNANAPPVITGIPATSVVAPGYYAFTPQAKDANHDTLAFSIVNKPSWASFSSSTGTLNGNPPVSAVGTYRNILISVSDGKASAALPAFNIVVTTQSSSSSSSSSSISSSSSSSSSASSSSSKSSSSSSVSSSSSRSSSSSSTSSSSSSSSSSTSSGALSIHVDGKYFKNASGAVVQLRGANLMGMEYTAIAGWSPNDPYPQLVESNWAALHSWGVNIIRIPLNDISYLGLTCVTAYTGPAYGTTGATQNADPGGNYKTRLKQVVDRATAEGFFVILDLHITAPDDAQNKVGAVASQCATAQNPVADNDHALAFWTGVATAYKGYPNILFELFNEPYINQWYHFTGTSAAAWQALRDGVLMDSYVPLWATTYGHTWQSAGMQQMLNAVRATGATNVILEGGLDYSATLDMWLTYKASDPLNQLAAVWHAYPAYGYAWGNSCYTHPGWCDDRSYNNADAILAANYPVIVTEFGDQDSAGTVGAPFASTLLPKLDARGISYLGWTFTVAQDTNNVLIKDNNGTPTDGYGVYVKAHYLCRAAGTTSCP